MATGSAARARLIGPALVLGVLAVVGGVVWGDQRHRITPPPAASVALESSTDPDRPTLAVLGDDYAEGWGPGWSSGWVRLLADRMCWTLVPASGQHGAGIQGGTGFTTAGRDPGKARYADRVTAVTAGRPRVVLIQGGLNDLGAPTTPEITDAATETFTAAKQRADGATVIAIGPLLTPSPQTVLQEVARVSGALAAAARAAGIVYLDPLAGQWLADPQLFNAEGIYPTTDGYREFTSRLIADLESLGLTSACGNTRQP